MRSRWAEVARTRRQLQRRRGAQPGADGHVAAKDAFPAAKRRAALLQGGTQGRVQVCRDRLKPGGKLSIWVYAREGNGLVVRYFEPFRIHVSSKLPWGLTKALSMLAAVAQGHLYGVQRELLVRHSPRILDGAAQLCRILEEVRSEKGER